MTATHPPVAPLKPVRADRPAARLPATEVVQARPKTATPKSAEHTATVTRHVFHWTLIIFRWVTVVALVWVIYLAFTHNWVGQAADAVATWYATTVAPHLELDFLAPPVPTVEDGLVGPVHAPTLVTTD